MAKSQCCCQRSSLGPKSNEYNWNEFVLLRGQRIVLRLLDVLCSPTELEEQLNTRSLPIRLETKCSRSLAPTRPTPETTSKFVIFIYSLFFFSGFASMESHGPMARVSSGRFFGLSSSHFVFQMESRWSWRGGVMRLDLRWSLR